MLQLSFYLAMIDGEEEQHKFEQLYHAYEGLLLYRAKQLLSDFQLAEEAASTTFVYIAKNMNMVEQVESPRTKALLLQVLNHTAIDLARKQKKRTKSSWGLCGNRTVCCARKNGRYNGALLG